MTIETLVRHSQAWTLESRRVFHQLPLAGRQRQLAEQVKLIADSSTNSAEHRERAVWQGGDIAEE